jgi:hypothetical protein
MVPCPFFSRPSKKQLRVCGVFRKKVTVVKGSCLGAVEIENLAVRAWKNVKFCQKLGKSASKMFQVIKQAYSEEAIGCSAVFKWHKHFAQGRDTLETYEHIGRPRTVRTELKVQEVATLVCANRSQTVDEIIAAASAGISHGTCHKILSNDLNMSRVTQHCSMRPDLRST